MRGPICSGEGENLVFILGREWRICHLFKAQSLARMLGNMCTRVSKLLGLSPLKSVLGAETRPHYVDVVLVSMRRLNARCVV